MKYTKNHFSETELIQLLEIARRGLSDADTFDDMADHLDLIDEEMKRLQTKLNDFLDSEGDDATTNLKAKFVQDITLIDPDSKMPVDVSVYKEDAGGMFAVDSSYIEQEVDDVHSPFGNGILELIGD